MQKIDTIIFDFGGVLVDWNPRYLYKKIFDSEDEMEAFLASVCTTDWNALGDKGHDFITSTKSLSLQFPEYTNQIMAYYSRWEEMLGGPIEGTVDILNALSDTNYRLLGLTNWSHQTFPIAQERYDFLNIFEGIVVSGIEKMIKPYPEIYQLIIDRYSLDPSSCLFIDDAPKNIEAAAKFGIRGIVFQDPKQLKIELQNFL